MTQLRVKITDGLDHDTTTGLRSDDMRAAQLDLHRVRAMIELLLLFTVKSVLPQSRAILFDTKFLSARLSPDRIVVVAALLANEENSFSFLLTSGHREGSGYRLIWAIWKFRVAIIAVQGLFRQVEMAVLAAFLGSALPKSVGMIFEKGRQLAQQAILATSPLLLKSKKHEICDDFCCILSAVAGTLD